MADITMCNDITCPSKHDCYRFMAKANEYMQSYGPFEHDWDGACDDYIPVKPVFKNAVPKLYPLETHPYHQLRSWRQGYGTIRFQELCSGLLKNRAVSFSAWGY